MVVQNSLSTNPRTPANTPTHTSTHTQTYPCLNTSTVSDTYSRFIVLSHIDVKPAIYSCIPPYADDTNLFLLFQKVKNFPSKQCNLKKLKSNSCMPQISSSATVQSLMVNLQRSIRVKTQSCCLRLRLWFSLLFFVPTHFHLMNTYLHFVAKNKPQSYISRITSRPNYTISTLICAEMRDCVAC